MISSCCSFTLHERGYFMNFHHAADSLSTIGRGMVCPLTFNKTRIIIDKISGSRCEGPLGMSTCYTRFTKHGNSSTVCILETYAPRSTFRSREYKQQPHVVLAEAAVHSRLLYAAGTLVAASSAPKEATLTKTLYRLHRPFCGARLIRSS